MSNTPDSPDPLLDGLVEFTSCIGAALEDICSFGLTIGESYVPFDPDPDDEECDTDEAVCSQAWVRVASVNPAYAVDGFGGDCGAVLTLNIEVGVIRCVEIPEDGEAPTATDVLVAALQSMDDMRRIHCAAMECGSFDTISAGAWTPFGPRGGQYGGSWQFTVEV